MMSATSHSEFPRSRMIGEVTPILAAFLALAAVAFTSWFWLAEDQGLLSLAPLYVTAAFFCVDMAFLRRRLRTKSKEIY
jgi:hypothetical protein